MTSTFTDVTFTATFHDSAGIDGTSIETVTVTARVVGDEVTVAPVTTCGPGGMAITVAEQAPEVAHGLIDTVTTAITRMTKENQE